MSTFEEPKTTIFNLLKNHFLVTKDDQSNAIFDVSFEFPEQELSTSLEKNDVLISIGREKEESKRISLTPSFQYVGVYRVGVWTKDKSGVNGEQICTKSVQKIKAIIKQFEKTPGGNLRFIRIINTKDDDRLGSPIIFHRIVMVETWHFSGQGGE
jgi:hypothetical protein